MAARKKTTAVRGINLDGSISKPWQKFKTKLEKYNDTPIQNWKSENFLGHIFKRYSEHTKSDFPLSYSGAPSKCKELYCVNRMVNTLSSNNNQIVKDYIDFVFDEFIIKKSMEIKSLAFFFTDNFIFKFKETVRKSQRITRATTLPNQYDEIIKSLDLSLSTYGDLAFAKLALDQQPDSEGLKHYKLLFSQLENMGLDIESLTELEN